MRTLRKYRQAAPAKQLLEFDRDEPVIVLCRQCVHLLKYADANI
jgi:hypothetical protein